MAGKKKLEKLPPPPVRMAEEDRPAPTAKVGFWDKYGIRITVGLAAFGALCSGVQLLRNTLEPWRLPAAPPTLVQQMPLPDLPSGTREQPTAPVPSQEVKKEGTERFAGKEPSKSELLKRMQRGESIVTTPDKLARDATLTPWLYGYGVKYVEQGDGEPQVKISWHICPADLSKVLPGIRNQCLASPEERRREPLFTSELK